MYQRLRKHISPATVLAFVALVFALTGGAFAATGGGSGSPSRATTLATAAKAKPKAKTGPRGPAGPRGATGATGAAGPAGAAGPTGPAGAGGAKGESGAAGPQGAQGSQGEKGEKGAEGEQGPAGTTGFTKTLPSGETETGTFAALILPHDVEANASEAYSPISFSIPLKTGLGAKNIHYVTTVEQTAKTQAECPGTAEEPKAVKGDLCIYQGGTWLPEANPGEAPPSFAITGICPPSKVAFNCGEGRGTGSGTPGTGPSGAVIAILYAGPEHPNISLSGSWAVTAP
jgi:Collagen triple helix repeat (20 copies)